MGTKFHLNLYNRCWRISVWTKVLDHLAMPSLEKILFTHGSNLNVKVLKWSQHMTKLWHKNKWWNNRWRRNNRDPTARSLKARRTKFFRELFFSWYMALPHLNKILCHRGCLLREKKINTSSKNTGKYTEASCLPLKGHRPPEYCSAEPTLEPTELFAVFILLFVLPCWIGRPTCGP